jgi:hypothetical protein
MAKATKKTAPKANTQTTAADAAPVEAPGNTPQSLGEFYPGSATARSYDLVSPKRDGKSVDGDPLNPPEWTADASVQATLAFRRGLTVRYRPGIRAYCVRANQAGIDALQAELDATVIAHMQAHPSVPLDVASSMCEIDLAAMCSIVCTISPQTKVSRDGEKVLAYYLEHVAGRSWDDKRLQEEEGKRATLVGKVTDAEKALGLDAGTLLKGQADQIDSQVSDHMSEWETANPNPAELEAAAVELEAVA